MPSNCDLTVVIAQYLLDEGGYVRGETNDIDVSLGLDSDALLTFIAKTQAEEWQYIENNKGERTTKDVVLHSLCQALNAGHLGVLQHGFQCLDKTLLVLGTPEISRLTVIENFKYAQDRESIDLILSVNGLPVATVLTSQLSYEEAVHRYRHDVDSENLLFRFNQRTLVHFATGPHEVHVSTNLQGKETFFTPLNLQKTQKGEVYGSDYLWKKVLPKENLLDTIRRFMSVQVKEDRETIFFPLYHPANWVDRCKSNSMSDQEPPPLPDLDTKPQLPVPTEAESYLSSPDPALGKIVSEIAPDDSPTITEEDEQTVISMPSFSVYDENTEPDSEEKTVVSGFSGDTEEATRLTTLSDRANWEKKLTTVELAAAINSADLISISDGDILEKYFPSSVESKMNEEGWTRKIKKLVIDVVDFVYITGSSGEQIEEIIKVKDADLFKTFTGMSRDNFLDLYRSGIIDNDKFNRVIWQFNDQGSCEPAEYIFAHLNTEKAAA